MKSRLHLPLLAVSLLISIALHSEVSAAPIPYKKKVQVQPFQNPPGWVGTYSPGALISDLLKQKLVQQENVILARFMDLGSRRPNDKNGNSPQSTPAQIIISGEIVKFRPALSVKLESTKSEKKMSRSAEVQIVLKIFQGQTRRFVTGFTLSEKSVDGKSPLGYSESSLHLGSPDFQNTFMGKALIRITDRMMPAIVDYLDDVPLDGHVIAVDKDEEQMIINVGQKSGVEVRDEFVVYSVDVNFPDPLYKEDIGDRLTQLGVVRVINVQEGFSEAVIMAGRNFVKGNLVRSKKSKPLPKILKNAR
jgi:nucleoid DNA-binding protein